MNNEVTCKIKNAKVLTRGTWRNFSGTESDYNRAGDRNFTISIPEDLAKQMMADGWDIHVREPENKDYDTEYTLKVSLKYNFRPPLVYFVTDGRKRQVSEDEVGALDRAYIDGADLLLRQYNWTYHNKSGVKACLVIGYFHLVDSDYEDPFADDYANFMDDVPFDTDER